MCCNIVVKLKFWLNRYNNGRCIEFLLYCVWSLFLKGLFFCVKVFLICDFNFFVIILVVLLCCDWIIGICSSVTYALNKFVVTFVINCFIFFFVMCGLCNNWYLLLIVRLNKLFFNDIYFKYWFRTYLICSFTSSRIAFVVNFFNVFVGSVFVKFRWYVLYREFVKLFEIVLMFLGVGEIKYIVGTFGICSRFCRSRRCSVILWLCRFFIVIRGVMMLCVNVFRIRSL